MVAPPLCSRFLSALAPGVELGLTTAQLEARIAGGLAQARQAHPKLPTSEQGLVAFCAARVRDAAHFEGFHWSDAALAFACAEGEVLAIARAEQLHAPQLDRALARLRLAPAALEDARQRIREEVYVGSVERRPKIADYGGAGSLGRWLCVTGVRIALKTVRRQQREVSTDDDELFDELLRATEPPDVVYMKALYRDAFRTAFQSALDALPQRKRTLLRQSLVDGLSVDQLGSLYRVHRATAARWVVSARDALLDGLRLRLRADLGVDDSECASILRLLQSQLDETIRRRLGGG